MTNFLQLTIDALLMGGLYALMAAGLSLGFGVVRIVNFAHGEFVMLGAYGAFWALTLLHVDPLLALPVLILLGYAGGWLLFRGVIVWVLRAPPLNQILLTFGIALVLEHIAVVLWTGDVRSAMPEYAVSATIVGDLFIVHGRAIAFAVAAVLIGGLTVWLRFSETGRAVRAVAQNRDAAVLMGIDPRAVFALAFAVATALGVASGTIVSFLINITPFMGFPILLKAIAIVVLGGLGSIPGTVLGAFILAIGETMIAYYVPEGAGWTEGVAFAPIVAILLLRPRGLVGSSLAT
jgi:branched-chain amino acid transport system permease protein